MSDPQGVEAETNEVPVNENDTEQVEASEAEAVVESEEEAQEPVEINYEAEHAKVKAANEAMQKKIDRQRAASSQHNAKIQQLNEKLASLEKVETPQEPGIDQFETHEEYVNAVADFRADERVRVKEQENLAKQQQEAMQKRNAEQKKVFEQQEAAYRAENPDYERAKTELSDHLQLSQPNNAVADAIYAAAELSGSLPSIIDYFGKDGGVNLPEFDRVASLSPLEAAYEVFKIANAKTDAKPKTKPLPKPVKTVKGSNAKKKDLSQGDVLKNLGLKS